MSKPNKSLGQVVVTGGCGFLGSHIVKLLVERYPDSRVQVLDLRTSNNRVSSSNVSYHDGDITDEAALVELFKTKLSGADVVIHTASPHAVGVPDEVMRKVNVDGTRNLLRAARENGVKALVYTSSASVIFDNVNELVNADETYPLIAGKDQPSYYTSTKVHPPLSYPLISQGGNSLRILRWPLSSSKTNWPRRLTPHHRPGPNPPSSTPTARRCSRAS